MTGDVAWTSASFDGSGNVTGAGTIQAGAVENSMLADDAVDSDEIAAGAIDLAHMSVNSIDSDQYVDGSIDNAHIAALAITQAKIADEAVGAEQIESQCIDSGHLTQGLIDTAHIGNDQITNALMADNAINSAQLAAGSVDNAHLSGSIADSNLSTISTAGKVDIGALEIDGATDIGAGLADADLFIVDDNANGTERKCAASRIPTYVAAATMTLTNSTIDGGSY